MINMALEWNKVNFSVRQGFWMTSRKIIHEMDIRVPVGSVLGLVGPNGAGKTTTIKLGAGLLYPDTGQVLIHGKPAVDAASRRTLGLLTETQYIYPHLKLREWLVMLAGFSGLKGSDCTKQVEKTLSLVALDDRAHQMMFTLSKGQLQRAGLAQALVHKPDILMLDEPMSGLDPYWRYRMQKILLDFKSAGGTILFSSHILADVERLCDQVALIEGGRLRWIGRLSDMQRNIRGYEAICHTSDPEVLKSVAQEMVLQPEGQWQVSLSITNKDELLRLASSGLVNLESLRPVQDEIEEVLFSFSGKKDAKEQL